MSAVRIALANLRIPATPEESVALAAQAVAEAGAEGAGLVCFPECFVPGYRCAGRRVAPPDPAFLDRAWAAIARAAAKAGVAVVLGTERVVEGALRATALVVQRDGSFAGFQDKVQLDVSEEGTYAPGAGRSVFQAGPLSFGIAICHEGWRYPETVRWAARRGAHVVFHPHFHEASPGSYRPASFADPANTFHEKAVLCRAAENTCYVATVNCASPGSPTTSAVVRPDGTLLCFQPYGEEGLLTADLDLAAATGLLAARCGTGAGMTGSRPERLVALFRGINVGAAKRVAMADLQKLLVGLGYGDVRTLQNSGNVVFSTKGRGGEDHGARIAKKVAERLGVESRVTVFTGAELASAVRGNPLAAAAKDPSRLLLMVAPDAKAAAKLKPLEKEPWAPEALAVAGRVAYLWCAGGVQKSRLWAAADRALGGAATARNLATMSKLLALVEAS